MQRIEIVFFFVGALDILSEGWKPLSLLKLGILIHGVRRYTRHKKLDFLYCTFIIFGLLGLILDTDPESAKNLELQIRMEMSPARYATLRTVGTIRADPGLACVL
jgi:hypothetical protein